MEDTHTTATPPPAWYPDPLRAHEFRYWNGTTWTDDVSDAGVVSHAPLASPDPPRIDNASEGADRPARALEELVERYRPEVTKGPVFVHPDIPEDRLRGALSKYARSVDADDVVLLADTTLRGTGKAGLVLTPTGLFAHEVASTTTLPLDAIHDVDVSGLFVRVAGEGVVSAGMLEEAAGPLVELLNAINDPRGARTAPTDTSDRWTHGAAPMSEGAGRTGLAVTRDGLHPGDQVPFTLRLDPWPDPKFSGAHVELAFQHTHLNLVWIDPSAQAVTPVGMLLSQPAHWEALEVGPKDATPGVVVVASTAISAADIGDDGTASGSLALPADCPATIPGVVMWQVRAHVGRRHGLDHDGAVSVQVTAPERADAAVDQPTDWIVRAFATGGDYDHRVAAADRYRETDIVVHTRTVAPGGAVYGEVTALIDPVRHYRRRAHAITSRGDRRIEESAARMPHSLEVEKITVSLECWRGSPGRKTCHRVARITHDVWGPGTIEAGDVARFPFSIPIPRTAPQALRSAEEAAPPMRPLIPSFRGERFGDLGLDEIRWRVQAQIIAPAAQFRHLPGAALSGLDYTGESMTGPLWSAAEIVVTPATD